MAYEMEIKDEARAALRALPEDIRHQIGYRLHRLQQNFDGDVKKLKGSKNDYRLRVGTYRVLFEVEGKRIVVYTVGQRKDIYQ
jgi:mRNA interferase RelE/StbE